MSKDTLPKFEVNPAWKEKGVAFLIPHSDDEALVYGAAECLC
jgi:hypothetical protein